MAYEPNRSANSIICKYLVEKKYDGLFNWDSQCSCLIDDLEPCGAIDLNNCFAGHKQPCPNDESCGCGQMHIGALKASNMKKSGEIYGS